MKELATDSHYLLSDTKYPVTFEYAGQDIAVVKISANEGKAIENDLIYGSVTGKTVDEDGNIVLGDEVLTPDSSRFWPLEGYEAGKPQPSYDKQFVRDWLKANPDSDYKLPQDVIDKTIAKYVEAYKMITGKDLD